MAIIKLKRSGTTGSVPSTSDLAEGEVAFNTADQKLFTKDSSGTIVTLANYSVGDANLVFPTGDYGSLTDVTTDAFGIPTERSYDCRTAPAGLLTTEDLGGIT
jgi:hypothetical protein